MHILALSGSLRKGSYNTAALHAAQELLPEGVTMEIGDFSDLPLYNSDIDGEQPPESVRRLREQGTKADALLICSPEYNYSIPGALKNAIDWMSRPAGKSSLMGKAVAIMGASTGMLGTARMQYHLRQVFVFLDMHAVNKPEIMIAKVVEKFDANGKLTDEMTRKLIGQLLTKLKGLSETVAKGDVL